MEGRICRRCLLREDADNKPLYQLVMEVVQSIPEEQKVPETAYRSRLTRCQACDHLSSGMCALCGCYVEVRACKQRMGCPDLPPKW